MHGYRLGPLLHELGLAALPESNLRELAYRELETPARSTGDMAFLLRRSGFESVCLSRIAGNFAIQTMTQGEGDRHPLGMGAGGLAILAVLPDAEVDIVLKAVSPQMRRYRLSEKTMRQRVLQTRTSGFAIDKGSSATDVTAIGRAVRDKSGAVVGAVFVASIRSRMVESRLRAVDKHLASCVSAIARYRAKAFASSRMNLIISRLAVEGGTSARRARTRFIERPARRANAISLGPNSSVTARLVNSA